MERRPSSHDSISDFGRLRPSILCFLLLLIFRLIPSITIFSDVQALVAENFRLSWMDPESHFSVLRLNSHNILWSCSFEDANRSTSSTNLMFVRRSLSLRYIHIPFFYCQRGMSSSNAFCKTVLKSKLDNGSPCVVPFLISNMSLSSSVSTCGFLVSEKFLQEADVVMVNTARFGSIPN